MQFLSLRALPKLGLNIRASADRVVDVALMSVLIYREPVPESILPAADGTVVVANGAVPMNALQIIGAGIRHDDAGAAAPSWTSSAADAGFVIKVGRGIDDDTGEVLGY